MPPSPTPATFEEALAALEAIVARMEASDLPLEEIIDAYEKGSRLLALCETRIADARQRVEKIAAASNGITLEPASATAPTSDELF